MNTLIDKSLIIWLFIISNLAIIAGVLFIGNFFYPVVALFGITFVITYILLLPVNWLEGFIQKASNSVNQIKPVNHLLIKSPEANPRILSVIIVYILFFAVVLSSSVIFIPRLGNELNSFSKDFTQYVNKGSKQVSLWINATFNISVTPKEVLEGTVDNLTEKVIEDNIADEIENLENTTETDKTLQPEMVKSTLGHASEWIGNSLTQGLDQLFNLATGTLNGFIYFLSGALLVFYFLLDGIRIKQGIVASLPEKMKPELNYFFKSFHSVMFSFIKGQVLLGMLTGTYMFIIYTFFGVPYAFFLGVFLAVAELLPVIGTVIGLIPAIIIMLFTIGPVKTLIVWLFSYGFQTIKDNALAPKIVGDAMGLHPLVVILSLLICAQAAGIVGVLLALPLASLINVTLRYFIQKESDLFTGVVAEELPTGEISNG